MNLLGNKFLPMIGGGGGGGALLLDSIAANTAYSVRKLRTAYGGPCVRLRRSSDNVESDFGFVGNALDAAGISSWLGANSGYVVTWYDQTGNGNNATQADTTKQPLYVASSFGGKPSIRFDGANDGLSAGSSPAKADAFTIAVVAATHKTTSYPMLVTYSTSSVDGWNVDWDTGDAYKLVLNLKTTTGGWVSDHYPKFTSAPTADQGYRVLAYRDAGNSAVRVNGSEVTDTGTTTPVSYGATPVFTVGNHNALVTYANDRDIAEVIYMATAASAGEMSSIDSSQSSYFGV